MNVLLQVSNQPPKFNPKLMLSISSWFPILTAAILALCKMDDPSYFIPALWITGIVLQWFAGLLHLIQWRHARARDAVRRSYL
jgi:hypothetical protein